MGHFSVKLSGHPGSLLSANQHRAHVQPQLSGPAPGARPGGGAGHPTPTTPTMRAPTGPHVRVSPGLAHTPPEQVFRGYDGQVQRDERGNAGDRRGFGREFHALRQYHPGAYRRPEGWYNNRWRHGDILPPLFWAESFWLIDYWMYDLPPPPYGYVWVRNDGDAILINKYTGEIIEVVYGVFY